MKKAEFTRLNAAFAMRVSQFEESACMRFDFALCSNAITPIGAVFPARSTGAAMALRAVRYIQPGVISCRLREEPGQDLAGRVLLLN